MRFGAPVWIDMPDFSLEWSTVCSLVELGPRMKFGSWLSLDPASTADSPEIAYSHNASRWRQREQLGRCKSHLVLELVHRRHDFCLKLGVGVVVHRFEWRTSEDFCVNLFLHIGHSSGWLSITARSAVPLPDLRDLLRVDCPSKLWKCQREY